MGISIDPADENGVREFASDAISSTFPERMSSLFFAAAAQTVIDNVRLLTWNKEMKLQRLILALLALTFALAPLSLGTAVAQPNKKKYNARLISPRPGQVLIPGQVVRVEWTSDFPDVDLAMCETEVLLSLDGGKTIYMLLTEQRNPNVQYFNWTVPNTPTNAAVLDIRFGCLNLYAETSSLQVRSSFVIGPSLD